MDNLQHESLSREFGASSSLVVLNKEHPEQIGYAFFLRRADPAGESKP